jgi:hypothetical protein
MQLSWFNTQISKWLLAGMTLGLMALLTACPGGKSVTGTLVVTIQGLPAGLEAAATVSGPGGFSETLTASGTLENLSPGSYTVSASAVSQGTESYSATVSGSPATVTPGGTATVSVSYAQNNPNPDPDPDPAPDPDAPTISSVSLQGYGASTQVRQGPNVIVEITGTNLSGITFAKLGDINGVVQANNPISAAVAFTIPHATELGPKTLSLTADLGVATLDDAVTITATTAGPAGNDATGKGTPDSPFRSLNKAVSVVEAGDSILLLDGEYSEANGEVWPVTLEDLVLMGESRDGTVLIGPGSGQDGLDLRGVSQVGNLTVTGFRVGLRATNGTLNLEGVSSKGHEFDGLLTSGGGGTVETLTISGSSFRQNGRDGIRVQVGIDELVITDSDISENGEQGLLAAGSVQLTISTTSFGSNNQRGIFLSGSAKLTLSQSTVVTNNADGIQAIGTSDLFLNNVMVQGSLLNGIDRAGTGRLELRNSQIINNAQDGLRIRNSPVVNLGDALETGNNTIAAGFAQGDLIADDRAANSVPKIIAYGVQLGDLDPAPTGSHNGPGASNTPYWRITNVGNVIDFGP